MKAISWVLAVILLPVSAQGEPLPRTPAQQVKIFATCAGRLSALMEHQWMFDGPASERTERLRDGFDALLEAVLPDALAWGLPERDTMQWRISAKAVQAELLRNARFRPAHPRAERDGALAEERVSACTALLTG